MAKDTELWDRKQRNPIKVISAWLGLIALVVTLGAGFSKSYYVTPLQIEQHDKRIDKLEAADVAFATRLQEQRELLLEIRGDIKVLNRSTVRSARSDN